MPCKIYLRPDQSLTDRAVFSRPDRSKIFAPSWVKEGLKTLGQHLNGVTFEVFDNARFPTPSETLTITEDFNQQSLTLLQKIARNESHNVSGVINKTLYADIKDVRVLYSIRDLVRQCVIVGRDYCSSCGGYRCPSEVQAKQRVYICDLAALQFQQPYNTGRLILLQKEEPYKGILDDVIYEHVVGERKRSYSEVISMLEGGEPEDIQKRYLPHDGYGLPGQNSCLIDIQAYRKFVARDVVLAGTALSEMASAMGDQLHFKFLKYGTGFFAWRFQTELERQILSGVVDGLENLFGRGNPKVQSAIRCVELPFFKTDPKCSKRIQDLKMKYGIDVQFSTNDALKQTMCVHDNAGERLVLGTTNCGDNHAVCGNEMGFSSVDAAIAENLDGKGNFLCPNINTMITEEYLKI